MGSCRSGWMPTRRGSDSHPSACSSVTAEGSAPFGSEARLGLGAAGSFPHALAAVGKLYLDELMQTHDAHEGLAAFMEKRPAEWQNK